MFVYILFNLLFCSEELYDHTIRISLFIQNDKNQKIMLTYQVNLYRILINESATKLASSTKFRQKFCFYAPFAILLSSRGTSASGAYCHLAISAPDSCGCATNYLGGIRMLRKATAHTGSKRIAALLMCALLTLSLAACGGASGTSSSSTPPDSSSAPGGAPAAEGTTQITVWLGSWWADEAPRIEQEFAQANPGYTAKIELMRSTTMLKTRHLDSRRELPRCPRPGHPDDPDAGEPEPAHGRWTT
jgi:hypothetical protein